MFKLDQNGIFFMGVVLQGFLYGLYSGVFAMYLQYHSSQRDTNKKRSIVFYSLCVLYVLSVGILIADITHTMCILLSKPAVSGLHTYFIETTFFGCSDSIAQFILIYRCWIVWGCNNRVVIIPSILTVAFLVTWLVSISPTHISSGAIVTAYWADLMTLSGLTLSLAVNALVTGLIVFRIFKVFREVKAADDQILGASAGSKLRRVMFIIIESGMALFSIQLVRVVVTILAIEGDYQAIAFTVIAAIHEMLNGITPTIILVRTSMGLSFHDEKSMEEAVIGSLRFVSNHSNSLHETESMDMVGQDNRDDES